MKTIVKWADMKKVGVPRRAWCQAVGRIERVPGMKKVYPAAAVARELGLPLELFERMK